VKKIDFKPFEDECSMQKLRLQKQSPLILHSNQDSGEPLSPEEEQRAEDILFSLDD
jgi:hypothetical protein